MQSQELAHMVKRGSAYQFVLICLTDIQIYSGNSLLTKGLYNQSMPVWSFCIEEGPDRSRETLGFVRAESAEAALEIVGDAEATIYPCCSDVDLPKGSIPFFDDPAADGGPGMPAMRAASP